MLDFPFVNMPDSFTILLQKNMQRSLTGKKLILVIKEDPSLEALVKACCKDIDLQGRLEYIINSIGWEGLRDRVASIYLSKLTNDNFHIADNKIIKELIIFEDKLKSFAVNGISRAYLLGFYLLMSKSKSDSIFFEKKLDEIVSDQIHEYLRKSRAKNADIDILIILFIHFDFFFGGDVVMKAIEGKASFEKIYKFMSGKQITTLTQNLLTYSASIRSYDYLTDQAY